MCLPQTAVENNPFLPLVRFSEPPVNAGFCSLFPGMPPQCRARSHPKGVHRVSQLILRLASTLLLLAALSTAALASGGDPQPPTPKSPVLPPSLQIR
jgi:hypothetical protein